MKNILIIEDDLILLNLLKSKLNKAGYNITSAENGKLGLKAAETEHPDLVLLDMMLPEMDGITILEKIRGNSSIASMPVIIISNSGQPFEIEKAKKLGIEDYLVKTEFDPSEVLKKVNAFFEKTGKNNATEEENNINKNKGDVAEKDYQKKSEEEKYPETEKGKAQKLAANVNQKETIILIIEDDKFLRELIAQKLVKEGMKVISAITAEEAFALLKKEKPHLILLDLILPGMNGFDLLKKINSDSNVSDIPVIVLSNLGEEKDKEMAMNLGAKSFLVKAMHAPKEIVEEVKKVLEKSYI